MKSVVATTYGGPEVLRVVDAPPPVAADNQVLVRVYEQEAARALR